MYLPVNLWMWQGIQYQLDECGKGAMHLNLSWMLRQQEEEEEEEKREREREISKLEITYYNSLKETRRKDDEAVKAWDLLVHVAAMCVY